MGAGQVARCRRHAVTAPSEARPGPPRNVGRRVREPTKEWRRTMRNFLNGRWQDEIGAAAAEYALILAIVAVGIAVAIGALGTEIAGAIQAACQKIDPTAACPVA